MEVQAVAKFVRVQPRKVRIVAAKVRGMEARRSSAVLKHHPSKGAFVLRKVIDSAIANAVENHGAQPEALRIARIMVDEGPVLKRIEQRAMGRGNRIMKKMSHITVVVEDFELSPKVKPHGTQAKDRPSFEALRKKAAKAAKPKAEEKPVEEEAVTEEPVAEEAAAEEPQAEQTTAEPEAQAEGEAKND